MTDRKPDPKNIARRAMIRTAGEVRFIKDKSNDANQWAWNDSGPQERKITPDFAFDPRNTKPLAKVLRSTNAALGHAMSAYAIFTKIKSADVSPDGSLGGKGYIQKIAEMRRAYMNVVEAMSALSDTLYDEIRAPHWAAVSRQEDPEERAEVEQIVEDAIEIKQDPEGWAEDQEEEMDEENEEEMAKAVKLASHRSLVSSMDTVLTPQQKKAFARVSGEFYTGATSSPNALVASVERILASSPQLKGVEFGLAYGEYDGDFYVLYVGPFDPKGPDVSRAARARASTLAYELDLDDGGKDWIMDSILTQWVMA
jgi:hypothetical protein